MTRRLLLTLPIAAVTLLVLLLPTEADAWGPLAHLSFSAQALANLGAVTPSLRGVLTAGPPGEGAISPPPGTQPWRRPSGRAGTG